MDGIMDDACKKIIWQQFGAAIGALEKAIEACPDERWSDRSKQPEFWYLAFHTLFWLDFYLSQPVDEFAPPSPFDLEELDPSGKLPPRAYTKDELLIYLAYGRDKCRAAIQKMTDARAETRYQFGRVDMTTAELLLYNMRHVQHHAAQLNLILRQTIDSAPGWVFRAKN